MVFRCVLFSFDVMFFEAIMGKLKHGEKIGVDFWVISLGGGLRTYD
jgi:hypothetical protein